MLMDKMKKERCLVLSEHSSYHISYVELFKKNFGPIENTGYQLGYPVVGTYFSSSKNKIYQDY